ncbi:hypothetical protein CR513_17361, partial [Mucuna pruriens]
MVGNVSSNFFNLVVIGERIEVGVRNRKIMNTMAMVKKAIPSFKKRKGEANIVTSSSTRHNSTTSQGTTSYQPFFPPNTLTVAPQPYAYHHPHQIIKHNTVPHIEPSQVTIHLHFRPYCIKIPKPHNSMFPKEKIVLDYDPNAKCEYHAGAMGHATKKCWGLKHKVQDLINMGWLSFKKNSPNTGNNLLPEHSNSLVNAIMREGDCMGKSVEEFRELLQRLMDAGLVQVGKVGRSEEIATVHEENRGGASVPRPLVIHFIPSMHMPKPLKIRVLAPFPYKNSKVVPWKYDAEIHSKTPTVTNIAGIGGMTRSGCIFAQKNL